MTANPPAEPDRAPALGAGGRGPGAAAPMPPLDGAGPLWLQIRRALAQPILDGRWPPGARIPAETELTERYGASRMTVNKALHSLAHDGLVERRRKRGTIVAERAQEHPVFEIWDVAAEVRRSGAPYSFVVHQRQATDGTGPHGGIDGLPPAAPLLWLLVEHRAGGKPVQLEERLVNLAAAPAARKQAFRKHAPGEWLLRQVPWTEARHAILARAARGATARLLQLEPGSACLVVERQTWNGPVPVTFARLWHPGEQHRLVGRFEPRRY
jgi:GntR family histidine utilization transcriptional repressor